MAVKYAILKKAKGLLALIKYRENHKYISLSYFKFAGYFYSYLISRHCTPGIFKEIFHVGIKFNGQQKRIISWDIDKGIWRAMSQKSIININIQFCTAEL